MTKERIRVLIGSPIRQKPEILDRFLTSLLRLEQDPMEITYFFIDDNQEEQSSVLLSEFIRKANHVIIHNIHRQDDYIRNETTHYWNEQLIWKVAD